MVSGLVHAIQGMICYCSNKRKNPPTLRFRACTTASIFKSSNNPFFLSFFLPFFFSSFLPFVRTFYPPGGGLPQPLTPQLENLFRTRTSSEPTFFDVNFRIDFGHFLIPKAPSQNDTKLFPKSIPKRSEN